MRLVSATKGGKILHDATRLTHCPPASEWRKQGAERDDLLLLSSCMPARGRDNRRAHPLMLITHNRTVILVSAAFESWTSDMTTGSAPSVTRQHTQGRQHLDPAASAWLRGIVNHEFDRVLFHVVTPLELVRLSHRTLHQLPTRDPAEFDLPDHFTWQTNLTVDHNNVCPEATGFLGETLVPTVDGKGGGRDHPRGVSRSRT